MTYYTHTPDDWAQLSIEEKRDAVVEAVRLMYDADIYRRTVDPGYDPNLCWRDGFTANQIATHLGIPGARRAGRGAVKYSWSGTMAPGLRIVRLLDGMAKAGVIQRVYDRESYRYVYYPIGERVLAALAESPPEG